MMMLNDAAPVASALLVAVHVTTLVPIAIGLADVTYPVLLTMRVVATPVACKMLVHAMVRIVEGPVTVAVTVNGAYAPDALVAISVVFAGMITIGRAAAAVHIALQKGTATDKVAQP